MSFCIFNSSSALMYLDSILLAHKDSWHLKDGTSIKIKSFFFPLMLSFSSVTQSCLTLCDPMDCSAPGFPVHHQPLELAQTPVHQVSDAINHLILYWPLLLLPSILFSIRVFSSESALRSRWPKYWSFSFNISPSNEYSGLISFRMDWLDLSAVQGTLRNLLQHHSFKSINSLALSL